MCVTSKDCMCKQLKNTVRNVSKCPLQCISLFFLFFFGGGGVFFNIAKGPSGLAITYPCNVECML